MTICGAAGKSGEANDQELTVDEGSSDSHGQVYIDLTSEEILTLVELLGLPAPAGLPPALADLSPSGAADQLRAAAVASLRGRAILSDDEPPTVDDAMVEVLTILTRPGLVLAVSVDRGGRSSTVTNAVLPEISIEQRSLSHSLLRLTPFASRDLLARALVDADLRPYEPAEAHRLQLSTEDLARVETIIGTGATAQAVASLKDLGIDDATADAFATALVAGRAAVSITVLRRADANTVAGGSLSWLDSGLAGLWVTEPAEDNPEQIVITLRDARSIVTELLEYLPAEFSRYPVVV